MYPQPPRSTPTVTLFPYTTRFRSVTGLLRVVDDGDVLRLDVVGNEVAGGRALQAVEADGTENQLVTAGGDVRAGGSRGDHQDDFVLIDVGRRMRGAGAEVDDNALPFVLYALVCPCRTEAPRVGNVVLSTGRLRRWP